MDEMFITCILDIVDPKRELSPTLVIKLVAEKFASTNKQSVPCDECSHWVAMCEHQAEYGSHDCKVLRR